MYSKCYLEAAKQFLLSHKLDALLIPTEDPHLSEYPASHWKLREVISGFTGSNGFLVITRSLCGLWTDSRYFLQAEEQLKDTGIQLFKEGIDIDWQKWLENVLSPNATIGLDGANFSCSSIIDIQSWADSNLFCVNTDCVLPIDMPALPASKVFIHDTKYCGRSFKEKRDSIFQECDCDYILLSALDEIAWVFNIRGNDIDYNPVCIAYAVLGRYESYIAIDNQKLGDAVREYFSANNIIVLFSYESIFESLPSICKKGKVGMDPKLTNYKLFTVIRNHKYELIDSPITRLKSRKNKIELESIRQAVKKDGVALVKGFFEIEKRIKNGVATSELDVADILRGKRSEQELFFCESFATIAGYGPNGAIVHYSATEKSSRTIGKESLLLVDSGANYLDGTTDITRVFCYGEPTIQQISDYTNVLKGHIAIARCRFPYGTEGAHIDALAHQYLWQEGVDYGHGTGHGIGFFLCVHEGPQRINRKFSGVKLEENMIISDEPGLYRTGSHGIRIENMVTVKPYLENEFGCFLEFETLTLFPYERKLINLSLLSKEEISWINDYHKRVYQLLHSELDAEEDAWLKNVTEEL